MGYDHTQKSPLLIIFLGLAAFSGWLALSKTHGDGPMYVSLGVSLLIAFLALCFGSLTSRDEGGHLSIRFGPIPLFRTKIEYSKMTSVAPARSFIMDGWGMHWSPGIGWIYNIWGFSCVKIEIGGKAVRVGTDDVEGLVRFLNNKLSMQINE